MSAPRDAVPGETFESKLRRANTRDPLTEIEADRRAGLPSREPGTRVNVSTDD
jgi:hypothetical protein